MQQRWPISWGYIHCVIATGIYKRHARRQVMVSTRDSTGSATNLKIDLEHCFASISFDTHGICFLWGCRTLKSDSWEIIASRFFVYFRFFLRGGGGRRKCVRSWGSGFILLFKDRNQRKTNRLRLLPTKWMLIMRRVVCRVRHSLAQLFSALWISLRSLCSNVALCMLGVCFMAWFLKFWFSTLPFRCFSS